jgi:KaiC/GvpD/RAD55 family RecA-like ATPase
MKMEGLIQNAGEIKRIKTNIENFDEQLEGGIPAGHVCLIAGSSGTMKSSISFSILYNEIITGKHALYFSLEQSSASLLNHMIAMGFDLSKVNVIILSDIAKIDKCIEVVKESQQGTLIVSDMGALRKQLKDLKNINPDADWLNCLKNVIKKLKENEACDLVTLDSLSALYAVSQFKNPRADLFHVFEFLRDQSVTTFLVTEMFGDQLGEYGVEDYLSDSIIKLAMVRDGRKVRRELNVVKMRSTNCSMDIYILDYKEGRFRALTKLPI